MTQQNAPASLGSPRHASSSSSSFRCAAGFYGNPRAANGTCLRCDCHGNVDVSEAGHCDVITGECLRCLFNTAGRHCEVCRPGYYGDAVRAKNCRGETCTNTIAKAPAGFRLLQKLVQKEREQNVGMLEC